MNGFKPVTPSDERYRLTFQRAAVGLAHVGLDGRWLAVNDAYCRILGYDLDELSSLTFQDITHPDDVSKDVEISKQLLAGEIDSYVMEKRYIRKDGGLVWVELHASIVRRDNGEPDFFIASVVDLTERKTVEAALVRSQELFEKMTRAAEVGTWEWDLLTGEFRWSAASALMFGMDADDIVVSADQAFAPIHPDDVEEVKSRLETALKQKSDYDCEFRVIRADGVERWVIGRGTGLYDETGRPVSFVGINVDITERKRMEEQLRLREQELSTLADTIPQLAWMADSQGNVFWYNRRWYAYTGSTPEESLGGGWKKFHHPEHLERAAERYGEAIRSGQPWEDLFPLRGKAGEWRWFLSRAQPIHDEQGKVVRWFGTNTDITDELEARKKVEAAVTVRDEFISIASHELRTPLSSIVLQIDGLQRRIGRLKEGETIDRERLERILGVSQRQVHRLAHLVDDMLDVSRLTTGRLTLDREEFSLLELARDVGARVKAQLRAEQRTLRLHGSEAVVGQWDRFRLEQVLLNLLTNAIKYAPGSLIDVTVRAERQSAVLSVRDYGPGVHPDAQARIFGRFERATSSSEVSGLGLGLFIANEIVRMHGGSLRIASEPGKGAEFIVELPLSAPEEEPADDNR